MENQKEKKGNDGQSKEDETETELILRMVFFFW